MIREIVKLNKIKLVIMFISQLILEICGLLLPIILAQFIDSVMYFNNYESTVSFIVNISILIISQLVLSYILTMISSKYNTSFSNHLKLSIISNLLNTPKRTINLGDASYYTKRIDQDTRQIINFLFNDTMSMVINIFKLLIMIVYLMSLSYKITIFLLILSALNIVIYLIFKNILPVKYRQSLERENEFYAFQNNVILNKNSLLRKSLFDDFNQTYSLLFNKSLKTLLSYINVSTLYNSFNQLIRFTCFIIIVILGGVEIINGRMSIGAFTLFNNYYNKLLDSITFFTGYLKRYQDYKVVNIRLLELYEVPQLENGSTEISNVSCISVENLSMKINDKILFNNLNLEFNTGNIYLIRGKNGIGKSTFFDILLGIEKDYNGRVYYNNVEINNANIYGLRKDLISLCEQNDILILDKNFKDRLTKYYIATNEFIDSTIVSNAINSSNLIELGNNISGGEKQKISLIQALTKPSSIILLDEPSNALDVNSIKLLKNEILKHKENKIILIISHSDDFLDICDYILDFNLNKTLETSINMYTN